MNRRLFAGIMLALSVLLLTACGSDHDIVQEENKQEVAEEVVEEVAEVTAEEVAEEPVEEDEPSAVFGEFLAIDVKGNEVTQEIFSQADLTMVNIWGTYCGSCIMGMPDLAEISKEYEGSGFQIVGIISDIYEFGDETVDEILAASGAEYTNILLSVDLYNNYLHGVQLIPTTVFVDSEGNQVGIYTGAKSKDEWVAIIEELRAQISE